MSLPHISPAKAKELIDRGAVLVDIREFDEHARAAEFPPRAMRRSRAWTSSKSERTRRR